MELSEIKRFAEMAMLFEWVGHDVTIVQQDKIDSITTLYEDEEFTAIDSLFNEEEYEEADELFEEEFGIGLFTLNKNADECGYQNIPRREVK